MTTPRPLTSDYVFLGLRTTLVKLGFPDEFNPNLVADFYWKWGFNKDTRAFNEWIQQRYPSPQRVEEEQ